MLYRRPAFQAQLSVRPKLKFSHRYAKMPENTENTILLEVLKAHYPDLSPEFRVYDTQYGSGYYPLPKADLIILLLVSYTSNAGGGFNEALWTTIRRATPEKEVYYRGLRGKKIEIEITEVQA